ncbi:hypothetical protein BBK14_31640 [Parafrankia soli]|uniref:DUF3618 domain-containing protein n=1 Tax=Parafrankia soli TaxID=2599596 RepID=A0A1S1RA45_9ACTN|nr:hypothetical protein [Parafrankia soli]OHV42857.1 hypothetical protein BBK14_31640 [Parafrankia soli]
MADETGTQASRVVDETQRQVRDVADEAKRQARDLVGETRDQVTQQASEQQQRVASNVRELADGLSRMAEQAPAEAGLAGDLARMASERLRAVGQHLENRQPADLLEDVRSFARAHPGVFLAGALVGGFVTGRLVRGATSRTPARPSVQPTSPPETFSAATAPEGRYYSSAADPAGDAVAGDERNGRVPGSAEPLPVATGAGVDAPPSAVYTPDRGARIGSDTGR